VQCSPASLEKHMPVTTRRYQGSKQAERNGTQQLLWCPCNKSPQYIHLTLSTLKKSLIPVFMAEYVYEAHLPSGNLADNTVFAT
jgi:hypothetical protein